MPPTEHHLVPGPRFSNASDVLEEMAKDATSLRGAVAFVTASGAERLLRLRERNPLAILAITARGAPITDPCALVTLADAGVAVGIVCGTQAPRFHPKLWIARSDATLHVLSGSGNATAGGLSDNVEQFEYFAIPLVETTVVDAHEQRLRALEASGVPLSVMRGTPYWEEWQRQTRRRDRLEAEIRALDERLAARSASDTLNAQLYTDLHELYMRTKAEVLIPDGKGGRRPYVASRFKQALERARREGALVPLVARMVKDPTQGLHHLADAGRPDLMVETVVLDSSRPYHGLFNDSTRADAETNLELARQKGATTR
ncbi:MAG: hypothetical protein GXY03_02480 [Solirubrobacterales bacterium]|nr:hypothetical protein [Solirubrobacterales bacterium]